MIIYKEQARANLKDLLSDPSYLERKDCLFKLIEVFNRNSVSNAVLCSANLFLRGIVDDFHDIDILIKYSDWERVKSILEGEGAILVETGGNGYCESKKYMHFKFGRVDMDIIADFRMETFETEYTYVYNKNQNDSITIINIKIELVPLEALYVLYYMMEGWQERRKYKRELIEEYLKIADNLEHESVLKDAINEWPLPDFIKVSIREILKK